ncbi:histidine kinase [Streptosporangium sp. NPDC051023]|uniref:sensor histidine kinase n=1 Tax=Streptosporangium sp. NPDC051023 TaxID=3155410 RepID=UPI003451097A
MTEHTPQDSRPRSSLAAAATALSRLGRLRDLPVILMLAWVGWLAIPWPSNSLVQARGGAGQPLTTGVQPPATGVQPAATGSPATGVCAGRVLDGGIPAGQGPGTAASADWTLAAAPAARSALLVKPVRPSAESTEEAVRRDPATEAARAESMCPEAVTGVAWVSGASPGAVAGSAQAAVSVQELIALERARIAGEVHDAAGHGLATVAMQAGVALLMLDERPDQVRESLEAIRSTSMQALSQLRSALDLIDPRVPGPDLPGLIAGVRAAGLPVDVEPAEPYIPAHLEGVVYRVVRESLTNVLRHAGPTEASVRVANEPGALVLEVADGGGGSPGATGGQLSPAAEGRGLAGMRARVTEAGGSFSAGPREDGGFRVVARFPADAV